MAAKPQKHRWKRRLSVLFLLVLAMVLYLRWENTTLQVVLQQGDSIAPSAAISMGTR